MTQAPEQSTAKGWMPDDSTFGARLALVRQHMRWGNVREAAVECGIPPESWRTWERDGVVPRRLIEMAGLISDRTGCDFGWLVAGPRLSSQGRGGPQATAHYFQLTERTSDHIARPPARPRDTRPNGQLAGSGPGRSAYLPRGSHGKRDR